MFCMTNICLQQLQVLLCYHQIFSPSIRIHMVAELWSIPLEDLRDRKGGKIEILKSEKF